MIKEKVPFDSPVDPILEINEFEEEAESILNLAKKEVSQIIQEAKDQAKEIIQREEKEISDLGREYLKKAEEEVVIEKEKMMKRIETELKAIESVPKEKIRKAVGYVKKRIIP